MPEGIEDQHECDRGKLRIKAPARSLCAIMSLAQATATPLEEQKWVECHEWRPWRCPRESAGSAARLRAVKTQKRTMGFQKTRHERNVGAMTIWWLQHHPTHRHAFSNTHTSPASNLRCSSHHLPDLISFSSVHSILSTSHVHLASCPLYRIIPLCSLQPYRSLVSLCFMQTPGGKRCRF
jgi:hypothetical protein